ncbi:hypothetical protein [Rhodopseudomonas palustris]|nr:hypothetical protein [Rhodopseudomonas palustris]
MPDLFKRAPPELASPSRDSKQALLTENDRLRETVAEIVLQLDALWEKLDPADLQCRQEFEFRITTFHRDN